MFFTPKNSAFVRLELYRITTFYAFSSVFLFETSISLKNHTDIKVLNYTSFGINWVSCYRKGCLRQFYEL